MLRGKFDSQLRQSEMEASAWNDVLGYGLKHNTDLRHNFKFHECV